MSNEIRAVTTPGLTLYALVFDNTGKVWNAASSAFEAYATGSRDSYDISVGEIGTSSGIYFGNFPTAITSSGTYEYMVYARDGATPVEPPTDLLVNTGTVDWTGTSAASEGEEGSLSGSNWLAYFLRGGYKRTDKNTEVYEATTDAIQEMRRLFSFDEAQADVVTTDEITVDGDFKIELESDLGLLLNVRIQDGYDSDIIEIIPKSKFDQLYPDINVTTDRGYPVHGTIYAGYLWLGPIPDQLTYIYRIGYSKRAGAVTSTTSAVPFTGLYRDALRDLVNHYLYEAEEEYEKATYFRNKFEGKFIDMTHRETVNQGTHCFSVRCQS